MERQGRNGAFGQVKVLHELGATNLDAVDEDGQTVLIAASQNGDVDSVKVLHEIKADLNLCGEGGTAMHHAAFGDQTEMLKILHQLGAKNLDAEDEDGHTAMMVASTAGNIQSVKVLLAMKANINVCTKAGTVMHDAVEGGHSKMIKTLHALGATNLDAIDEDDETAVMRASYKGDIESVKALHAIKADLNLCTKAGTAMHRAVDGCKVEMIKYLHQVGAANLDAVDKNGYTAMMIASAAGSIESVKVLIKSYETARKVVREGQKQYRLSRTLEKMRRAVKHQRLLNRLRKHRQSLISSRGRASLSSSRGRASLASSRGRASLSSRGSVSSRASVSSPTTHDHD